MKTRPILFSGPMVLALLDGSKTQTRRIYKTIKDPDIGCEIAPCEIGLTFEKRLGDVCQYGQPGDRLRVKETFRAEELEMDSLADTAGTDGIRYRADGKFIAIDNTPEAAEQWITANANGKWKNHWRPSIFMPTWASRITLEITAVRVERLQDITGDDCAAEGIEPQGIGSDMAMVKAYRTLWEQINGPGSWASNPYVWVIEFQPLQKPLDASAASAHSGGAVRRREVRHP